MYATPCFVDETGSLHHAPEALFAVGLLSVANVGPASDALYIASFNFNSRIREKRLAVQRDIAKIHAGNASLAEFQMLLAKTRHHEYKFTGINANNLQDYISLLNLFFSLEGNEFHALVVERTPAAVAHLGRDSWLAYVRVTKELLARRIKSPSFVLCDWQTRPTAQPECLEDLCCALPKVLGCVRITSETSPFLQVVDLLLGAVSFDWRDSRGLITDSTSSALKRHLVTFVKNKLGMSPTTRFLPPGGQTYFSRRNPLRFSAWQPMPDTIRNS